MHTTTANSLPEETSGAKRKASAASAAVDRDFDATIPRSTIRSNGKTNTFHVFDRVMVVVSVDESNRQRPKVVLRLAESA